MPDISGSRVSHTVCSVDTASETAAFPAGHRRLRGRTHGKPSRGTDRAKHVRARRFSTDTQRPFRTCRYAGRCPGAPSELPLTAEGDQGNGDSGFCQIFSDAAPGACTFPDTGSPAGDSRDVNIYGAAGVFSRRAVVSLSA